jgi:transposase
MFNDGSLGYDQGRDKKRGRFGYERGMKLTATLSSEQVHALIMHVDNTHAKGGTVTNRRLRNWIKHEYKIELAHSTMSNYIKKLGLKWIRTRPKKRTLGLYRHEHIRDF